MTQMTMNNHPNPTEFDLKRLREWLSSPRGCNSDLRGFGSETWLAYEEGGRRHKDLLALNEASCRTASMRRMSGVFLSALKCCLPVLGVTVSQSLITNFSLRAHTA